MTPLGIAIRAAAPPLLVAGAMTLLVSGAPAGDAGRLAAFLDANCVDCHGGSHPKADFSVESLLTQGAARDAALRDTWLSVLRRVDAGTMPPSRSDQPTDEARVAFVRALREEVPGVPQRSAGVRRVNRAEYVRSVRDLLGAVVDPAELPADDPANGFNTGMDALTLSPLAVERFVEAAERVADQAVAVPPAEPPRQLLQGAALERRGNGGSADGAVMLWSAGKIVARADAAREGRYRIRVVAWGTQAGDEPVKLALGVDGGRRQATFEVPQTREAPGTFEHVLQLSRGRRSLELAFINDYWKPDAPDPARRDRNAAVESVEVEGPLDPPLPGTLERTLPGTVTEETLAPLVAGLAGRAFRRPVDAEEVAALLDIAPAGASPQRRLHAAVVGMLASPSFLLRADATLPRGYGAAARLAAFLWSSLPDDALLADAAAGLETGAARAAAARRMLADPRARALAEEFAAQWLQVRELERRMPDPERFPGVDASLLADMREETVRSFHRVLTEGAPLDELVSGRWAITNAALDRHYGWPQDGGAAAEDGWRVRMLPPGERGGILRHASVLLATSNPTRTSPVKRGRFVMDVLLDQPPPPPPPGTPQLPAAADHDGADVPAMLARHREDPACAACHESMDAIGLALEGLDPVGRRRDASRPLAEEAHLPDGRSFDSEEALRTLLSGDPQVARTLARRLLTFATGRGLGAEERLACDRMVEALGPRPALRDVVLGVVSLDAFLPAPPEPAP